MNHPNGPHSERNDPSLSTVCCCCFLLKCTMRPGAAPGQQPPLVLVTSAQRGPLEGWALPISLRVDRCLVSEGPTLHCTLLCAPSPRAHGGCHFLGLFSPQESRTVPQSWCFLVKGVVVDGSCLSRPGKCPENLEVSTAF